MNEKDELAANDADPHQYEDNERDAASTRYDQYWLAFHDWCAARGIPKDDMRAYEREFEADYYGNDDSAEDD
jgi:hypothetical protein